MLSDDVAEVLRSHFPQPPATEAELAEFERAHGFPLDPELRAFYRATNGGRLFQKVDSPYKFMSLAEIQPGVNAIFGGHPPEYPGAPLCPDNVFAFCGIPDGCYLGFEVIPGRPYPIHVLYESWPQEIRVLAPSFGEFLQRALREGGEYWIASQVE